MSKGPEAILPAALAAAVAAHEAVQKAATAVAHGCRPEDEARLLEALEARRGALESLGRQTLAEHLQRPAAAASPTQPQSAPRLSVTPPARPALPPAPPPAAPQTPQPPATPPPAPVPAPPASAPSAPPPRPQPEPAPPPPTPPQRKGPVPSPESKERLVKHFTGSGPRSWDEAARVARALGPPESISSADRAEATLTAVEATIQVLGEQTDLPAELRRALLGTAAARTRHIQDETPLGTGAVADWLGRLFSQMTKVSKETKPGFVKGLSRSHTSEGPAWIDDAVTWWHAVRRHLPTDAPAPPPTPSSLNAERQIGLLAEAVDDARADAELCGLVALALDAGVKPDDPRLVALLLGHAEMLVDRRFRNLRKFVRQGRSSVDAESQEPPGPAVPDDWPWLVRTRDRRAVLVGGDRREKTEDRVREAFSFTEVEWDSGWHPRRVEALAARIQAGGVDLVILLARFLSHKTWDVLVPACKAAGVPFILVERGYGIAQIRASMEKVFSAVKAA